MAKKNETFRAAYEKENGKITKDTKYEDILAFYQKYEAEAQTDTAKAAVISDITYKTKLQKAVGSDIDVTVASADKINSKLDTRIQTAENDLKRKAYVDSIDIEDIAINNVFVETLYKAVSSIAHWAPGLLELYLAGKEDESIEYLMNTCHVVRQSANRYRQLFENYIKIFLFS